MEGRSPDWCCYPFVFRQPVVVSKDGCEVARSGGKQSNAVFSYYEVDFPTEVGSEYTIALQ